MQSQSDRRIAVVVSSPMTVRAFLAHQIQALAQHYTVTVIANLEEESQGELGNLPYNVTIHSIPIQRQIHPMADLKALWLLWRFFRGEKFDLIHSVSPKAGLLSVIAGWLARTPHRLHTFTGQVWATRSGFARAILKLMDRLIALFASTILVDSPSQRNFLVQQGVVKAADSMVLEDGSISGVDVERFHPDVERRSAIRAELGIEDSAFLVLFVGRLKRDKGVMELAEAFVQLRAQRTDAVLMMVGPDEENLQQQLIDELGDASGQAHFIPFTKTPEHYMQAADLFVLPSYREGFGTVIIEAAACGVPAVASRIYGLTDAVAERESGLLFEVRSVDGLAQAMQRLALDEELCRYYGQQALKRTREHFSQQLLTGALLSLYAELLERKR